MPRRCPPDTLCERDFVLIAPADTEKVAVRYRYDAFGRIDSVHWDGWKRRRNEVLPARSFVFDFDSAGRWVGLRNTVAAGGQTNPYVLGVGYNQDDQVDVFSWSRSGELALVTDTLDTAIGGGPLSTRDAAGRPTVRGGRDGNRDGRQSLYYDALGQLTQVGGEWYRYDNSGAGQLLKGFGMGTLNYNALGQLVLKQKGSDSTSYAYDAAGSRRSEAFSPGSSIGITILHDGFGRMASRREIQSGATAQVSAYWYDALGRRVLESDSNTMKRGTVGRFFYEAAGPGAGEVIFEQRNNQEFPEYFRPATVADRVTTIFLRGPMGPNHLLMFFPDGGYLASQGVTQHEIFALQDRQFTLYGEVQPGGEIERILGQRSAYGQPALGQGNRSVGYTGGQEGAGGLVFLRNRYYDPNSGSFTQEDPIGLAGGMNLYAYAGNDPVTYSDPLGLCPYILTGVPCSIGTAIGIGFVPIVGDAIEIAGAAVGRDFLTGESISGAGKVITAVGTLAGSGKLAREGVGLASRVLRGIPLPAIDATGKLHGKLPNHIPSNWSRAQLTELAGDLRSSIQTRKLEQTRLGEHGPHRRRISEEERLLRRVEKKLSGS